MRSEPVLKFPNKFFWGTATAAFQIEGHPEEYLGKLSDWSEWIDREDKVQKPTNEGRAVEHYQHLHEDTQLIKDLNTNAYRFSFNWARLHRAPGEFDENAAKFYEALLDQLENKNASNQDRLLATNKKIEPFATLVHFVLPNWLAKQGGWENPQTAYEFANFTRFLVSRFGNRIKYWMTHNEPNIFLGFGYESGIWPPGYENDYNRYFKAYQGLVLAHQLAYKEMMKYCKRCRAIILVRSGNRLICYLI
jgi:6-phospho-beta-glucosidase